MTGSMVGVWGVLAAGTVIIVLTCVLQTVTLRVVTGSMVGVWLVQTGDMVRIVLTCVLITVTRVNCRMVTA